jgi:AhpD family alkylhydroperoxidase
MTKSLREFREERERMNERILGTGNLGIKRFFALDARTYEDGALDARTKELLGLAASTVLRCDDCITYHLIRCVEEGADDDEIVEALNVALVVGGSIVIPHLRRAVRRLSEIRGEE